MAEQVEVKEPRASESKSPKIPLWACFLLITIATSLTFLVFGGADYIQHSHDIDSNFWHNERDSTDAIRWTVYLFKIGVLPGLIAFLGSLAAVSAINFSAREGCS